MRTPFFGCLKLLPPGRSKKKKGHKISNVLFEKYIIKDKQEIKKMPTWNAEIEECSTIKIVFQFKKKSSFNTNKLFCLTLCNNTIKRLKSKHIKFKTDDFWKYLRIPFDNEWEKNHAANIDYKTISKYRFYSHSFS